MDQIEALLKRDHEALGSVMKDAPRLQGIFRDCHKDVVDYYNEVSCSNDRDKMLACLAYVMGTAQIAIRAANDRRREAEARAEARAADLENRPTLKYCGVWQEGRAYGVGSMVTLAGSVWHCDSDTTTRPGTAGDNWTLAVKRGDRGGR